MRNLESDYYVCNDISVKYSLKCTVKATVMNCIDTKKRDCPVMRNLESDYYVCNDISVKYILKCTVTAWIHFEDCEETPIVDKTNENVTKSHINLLDVAQHTHMTLLASSVSVHVYMI